MVKIALMSLLAAVLYAVSGANAWAISLQDFVHDTVMSSPEVNEQIHIFRQAYQDEKVANSGWLPSLDLSLNTGSVDQKRPTDSNYDSTDAELTLTQNLFDGFDTTNQINQAKSRIASAVYRLYDTADNTALDAVTAYINVLSASELLRLAEKNVRSHEQTLDQLIEQNRAGIGLLSDLEQTRGRLAGAKASLISQQNNLHDALTSAHKLLGRYVNPDTLSRPALPDAPGRDISVLIDEALLTHPALKSARRNILAAQYDYKRSKSSNLPNVDLQLQQNTSDNQDIESGRRRYSGVFVNITYNLYRGGADLAEQRKKASEVNELEAFRKRVHRQVIDALKLSWTADKSLHEQLPLLDLQVHKAEKTLALYREEFLLNKRDLIDVLNAINELNTAEKRQAEIGYQALIARYRVYEGIGDLFKPLQLEVKASDTDFQIVGLSASGIDKPELDNNNDKDGFDNQTDQCDNSIQTVDENNNHGCEFTPKLEFNYHFLNTPPVAVDDIFYAVPGVALEISKQDILSNDIDKNDDSLYLYSFSKPLIGRLIEDAEGYLIYTAPESLTGEDEFTYSISDSRGGIASARVVIRIKPDDAAGKQQTKPDTSARIDPAQESGAQIDSLPHGLRAMTIVHFVYKQSSLTDESSLQLDKLARLLKSNGSKNIEVRAYTDDIGPQKYNLSLSRQRADLVRNMLIERGVDGSNIQAVGRGENEPIASNQSDEGRALNRRVEIRYTLGHADPDKIDGNIIRFAYKQTGLTKTSENVLDTFASYLGQSSNSSIIVRAYTDNVGSARYNRNLSSERAADIKDMLIQRGVDESRITAVGMGEDGPIADNTSKSGRQKNRRAELYMQVEL